mgnify:CR=1 FL=1
MSREIKFRAWDKVEKEMIEWSELRKLHASLSYIEESERLDARILMQYTGLKDKNGKEIYEGDIVEFSDKWEWYRCKYGISMMFAKSEEGDRYKKIKAAYEAEPMERRVVQFDPYDSYGLSKVDLESYWEIIGNIYQNPELLQANESTSQ